MAQPGSLLDLIQQLQRYRGAAALLFLAVPVLTLSLGWTLKRWGSRRACARFLTVPVHLVVLPGVPMALVVAYLLFFARQNLLAGYDAVVFFGPLVSMALTLVASSRLVPFAEVPGFERLSGLMLLSGVAFALTYFLYRMVFRVWFVASFGVLVALFVVAFLLVRLGSRRLFGPTKHRRGAD